jgi:hypothetical protein
MKTIIGTLATAAALAMATSAMADGGHGFGRVAVQPVYVAHPPLAGLREINTRMEEQRARIEAGFRRGAITRGEYRRLMAEHQNIRALERAYVSDGFLAPRERLELNRRLDIASQHIVFEAHDRQRRF